MASKKELEERLTKLEQIVQIIDSAATLALYSLLKEEKIRQPFFTSFDDQDFRYIHQQIHETREHLVKLIEKENDEKD